MDVRPEFESTRYQTWSYTSYDHRMTAIARTMNIPSLIWNTPEPARQRFRNSSRLP